VADDCSTRLHVSCLHMFLGRQLARVQFLVGPFLFAIWTSSVAPAAKVVVGCPALLLYAFIVHLLCCLA
jgi:hypothetical protein